MHIPDGLLDGKTLATTAAASAAGLSWALRRVRTGLQDKQVPLLGVIAAFIFAAQMINFPVWGGTSGHLIGGVLAAVALGPASAVIVMTTVLVVQALLFGDGGVLALGANVLNMGILAPLVGYWAYRLLGRSRVALFLAAWASILVSALAASLQLAWSGLIGLGVVLPPMLVWHALIGVGEGVITLAVVRYLEQTKVILPGEVRS